MSEFALIQQYFQRPCLETDLGIGDDAALITVGAGEQLAISSDMLVCDTHFFADTPAYAIGWKSMAVNISDMAAMGAQAKWATLALALPSAAADWLAAFSQGLFDCAQRYGVSLIGGDTTRGPLNISIQILGVLPKGKALLRSGAQVDDEIWHSGELGSAAYALRCLQAQQACPAHCLQALHHPIPRLQLGIALRGIAHSAIDVSDGLLADLGHILQASGLGAEIQVDLIAQALPTADLSPQQRYACILSGGDDYELCFTAPRHQHQAIRQISQQLDLPLHCIGRITAQAGLKLMDAQQQPIHLEHNGYDHFKQA